MQYTTTNKQLTPVTNSYVSLLKILVLLVFIGVSAVSKAQVNFKEDSVFIRNLFNTALTKADCYDNLGVLCKTIGNRISGSPQAEKAVDYTYKLFNSYAFDTVFKQDVMVPKWVRGDVEKAYVGKKKVAMRALGGSIGTPKKGISAEVIEVQGLEDLKKLGRDKIVGKIVFFNRPMDPTNINTFVSYGGCVDQRWAGPSEAAKYGAVATVCRSMTLALDDFPHTGSMRYNDSFPKIPAVAISTIAANYLSSELKKGAVKFKMQLNCYTAADVPSHNVIGQTNGSIKPNEFIICGGHLDSWDVGEGAHDDGAGCMQSMEALRLLKMIGYQPKHSLRAVMYMNEENGLRGAKKYAELAALNKEKHLFAIESDEGGFTPRGFHVEDKDSSLAFIKKFQSLLAPYGVTDIAAGGGGADVSTLRPMGTVLMNYVPDSQRYFDYHHTDADVFEAVNKRELILGASSMAALIYLIDKYYVE